MPSASVIRSHLSGLCEGDTRFRTSLSPSDATCFQSHRTTDSRASRFYLNFFQHGHTSNPVDRYLAVDMLTFL